MIYVLQVSLLMKKDYNDLIATDFTDIIGEMRNKLPYLYAVITAAALPHDRFSLGQYLNIILM
jgi:hypothetical protein